MPSVLLVPLLACTLIANVSPCIPRHPSRENSLRHSIPIPRLAFEASIRAGENGVKPDRPLVLALTVPSHGANALVHLVKNGAITLEDACDGKTQVVPPSVAAAPRSAGRRSRPTDQRVEISYLPRSGWKPSAVHSITVRFRKAPLWRTSFTTGPVDQDPRPEPPPGTDPQPDPGGPGDPAPQPDPQPDPPPIAPQPDVYTLTGRFGWGSLDPNTIEFSISKPTTITVSYNSLETVNRQYHQEGLYFTVESPGGFAGLYRGGGERSIDLPAGDYTIRAKSYLGASYATITVTVPRI
ncbi:MAG: hypothetical protein HPY55_10705 [Firmicutes bacterium]|nr:hypothetical protein [Bacillota bacterium]